MYARVTINFFGYSAAGKKGVGCGLGNVMKTRDGDALAGGASAATDFAGVGQSVQAPYDVFQPQANPTSIPNPAAQAQPAFQAVQNPASYQVNPLTGEMLPF